VRLFKIEANELMRVIEDGGIDPTVLEIRHEDKHGFRTAWPPFLDAISAKREDEEDPRRIPSRSITSWTRIVATELPGLYFQVAKQDNSSYSFLWESTTLEDTVFSRPGHIHCSTWDRVLYWFSRWVKREVARHVAETAEPDLWTLLRGGVDPYPDADHGDHFTAEQAKAIRNGLRRFRELIKEKYSPTSEQQGQIEVKLDHLAATVETLTKTDWKGIVISTLFGIATTLSITPDRFRGLLHLLQEALARAAQLLP
jgi:hypothetical protein